MKIFVVLLYEDRRTCIRRGLLNRQAPETAKEAIVKEARFASIGFEVLRALNSRKMKSEPRYGQLPFAIEAS